MPSSSANDTKKPKRGGRKRDASLDAVILDAAIEILTKVGYDRMTMDMVAEAAHAGKATVYRRWASKAAMVLDAVARMKRDQVDLGDLGDLADTGSLRGDILSLFRPKSIDETNRKLGVVAGLASLLTQEPDLARAAGDAIAAPWIEANRALMERAVGRGEIAPDAPIDTLSTVIPSLGAHRLLVHRQPFDHAFLVRMLDDVVLPALAIRPTQP